MSVFKEYGILMKIVEMDLFDLICMVYAVR